MCYNERWKIQQIRSWCLQINKYLGKGKKRYISMKMIFLLKKSEWLTLNFKGPVLSDERYRLSFLVLSVVSLSHWPERVFLSLFPEPEREGKPVFRRATGLWSCGREEPKLRYTVDVH